MSVPRALALAVLVLAIALAGCGHAQGPPISARQARAVWLRKFSSLIEANQPKGLHQTLKTPGVEQRCGREAEEHIYRCFGVIPEELERRFPPGSERQCLIAEVTIDYAGHINGENVLPIKAFNEAFQAEFECRV